MPLGENCWGHICATPFRKLGSSELPFLPASLWNCWKLWGLPCLLEAAFAWPWFPVDFAPSTLSLDCFCFVSFHCISLKCVLNPVSLHSKSLSPEWDPPTRVCHSEFVKFIISEILVFYGEWSETAGIVIPLYVCGNWGSEMNLPMVIHLIIPNRTRNASRSNSRIPLYFHYIVCLPSNWKGLASVFEALLCYVRI